LWHLQMCLQYALVKFTSSPLLRIVSTALIFPFSYMSTYFHHIHLPTVPFPLSSLLSGRTYFTFLSFIFEKRHFHLFKVAIQGVSLWHFHVSMYYITNCFIPSIFLLSTLKSLS
jgi:hypothetical protein